MKIVIKTMKSNIFFNLYIIIIKLSINLYINKYIYNINYHILSLYFGVNIFYKNNIYIYKLNFEEYNQINYIYV